MAFICLSISIDCYYLFVRHMPYAFISLILLWQKRSSFFPSLSYGHAVFALGAFKKNPRNVIRSSSESHN